MYPLGWVPTVKNTSPQVGSHPGGMPGRGTPKVTLRVPEDLWRRFGEATNAAGTDRATTIRELMRWYLREPEAKAPKRP
jgi:hypothetical protein